MRPTNTMSNRLHLPIHYRRTNRNRPSKLFIRYRPARHLLRSSPLPLRPIHRCSICNPSRLHPLIPTIHRLHPTLHMGQSPLWCNIRWRQPDLLPPTLPRPSRHATPILRLPRRLHIMKYHLFYRLTNLPHGCDYAGIHYLRSLRIKT